MATAKLSHTPAVPPTFGRFTPAPVANNCLIRPGDTETFSFNLPTGQTAEILVYDANDDGQATGPSIASFLVTSCTSGSRPYSETPTSDDV